jgi:hypothetical protein
VKTEKRGTEDEEKKKSGSERGICTFIMIHMYADYTPDIELGSLEHAAFFPLFIFTFS